LGTDQKEFISGALNRGRTVLTVCKKAYIFSFDAVLFSVGKEVNEMRIPIMRYVSWYLVVAMFIIGIAPRVDAGFSPSEIMKVTQTDRTADLQKIRQALEIKAVGERLKQLGLTKDEIQKRLSELSDPQIHRIALQLDDLRVGGDALGVIIAILVIAVLVIVILKLTGHRVLVT
jgi:hypothetical protein